MQTLVDLCARPLTYPKFNRGFAMLQIPCIFEHFPLCMGQQFQGNRIEKFSWAQIAHAAVTVGRQNWNDVLQHGNYSILELLWRVAMLHANLRQSKGRLTQSPAFKNLDRSEKGAVSFFLGLCMAKIFAERLLSVPWLLHLDVYRVKLKPTFVTTGRPDFIGMDANGHWVVIEAKGRTGYIKSELLNKAKNQTQALSTIDGQIPALRIVMATHFANDLLQIRIHNSLGHADDAVPIIDGPDSVARAYYSQIFDFIKLVAPEEKNSVALIDFCVNGVELEGLDVKLSLSEPLARWYLLKDCQWQSVITDIHNKPTPLSIYKDLLETPEIEMNQDRIKQIASSQISQDDNSESAFFFSGCDQISVHLGNSWNADAMVIE